jgi:hypothetical protein
MGNETHLCVVCRRGVPLDQHMGDIKEILAVVRVWIYVYVWMNGSMKLTK